MALATAVGVGKIFVPVIFTAAAQIASPIAAVISGSTKRNVECLMLNVECSMGRFIATLQRCHPEAGEARRTISICAAFDETGFHQLLRILRSFAVLRHSVAARLRASGGSG